MKGLRTVFVSLPWVGGMSLPHLRKKAVKHAFSVHYDQNDDLRLALQDADSAKFYVKMHFFPVELKCGV